jgi:hypothetical protein
MSFPFRQGVVFSPGASLALIAHCEWPTRVSQSWNGCRIPAEAICVNRIGGQYRHLGTEFATSYWVPIDARVFAACPKRFMSRECSFHKYGNRKDLSSKAVYEASSERFAISDRDIYGFGTGVSRRRPYHHRNVESFHVRGRRPFWRTSRVGVGDQSRL